jgi:peptidylprolyl isomerase
MRPRPLLTMVLTALAVWAVVGCGEDDEADDPARERAEASETSPSAQRRALQDTSQKPVIPRPSGSAPRRLVKDDIVEGRGRPARAGDTLTVHYVGVTFSTGEEFDASWNAGRPFTFRLGAGGVIDGWDRGLVGIKKGGRRMLTIPPEQAYGAAGYPPAIGPNETLVFVIDAVAVR